MARILDSRNPNRAIRVADRWREFISGHSLNIDHYARQAASIPMAR